MKGKKKKGHAEEKGKKILSTSHQQVMFSHALGIRTSIVVAREVKNFHKKCLYFSFFPPQFLLLSIMSYSMEYLFSQFRSAVLTMSTHHFLPTLSLLELEKQP